MRNSARTISGGIKRASAESMPSGNRTAVQQQPSQEGGGKVVMRKPSLETEGLLHTQLFASGGWREARVQMLRDVCDLSYP